MKDRFVLAGTTLNLATLLIGLTLGFLLGTFHSGHVHAQVTQPEVEEVTPAISAGSAAFTTLLAGRAAIDNVSVQGLDLIKFDENLMNLLATKPLVFSHDELQGVIDKSHPEKILRMKQPEKKPKEQK